MQQITLLNDLLFRIVFGNQKRVAALEGLLNAILGREGDSRIRELEIQNPVREKDRLEEKSSILDVKARDGLGNFYNIEVQLATQAHYRERTVYYGAGMVSQQPIAGKNYSSLTRCLHISLVDFPLFPEHIDVQSRFVLFDSAHDLQLTDLIEFHYLELGKFKLRRLEELSTPLQRWIFFLRTATEYQNQSELPIQLLQEEGINMAYEATHEALCDKEIFYELEARRKFLLDQATNLHVARTEGKAEGLAEGQAANQRATALRMRREGLSRDLIAAVTELAPAELDQIFSAE